MCIDQSDVELELGHGRAERFRVGKNEIDFGDESNQEGMYENVFEEDRSSLCNSFGL